MAGNEILSENLGKAYNELVLRVRGNDKLSEIQRMYGYCLGMYRAIKLQGIHDENADSVMRALMRNNFGQKLQKELRNYIMPVWGQVKDPTCALCDSGENHEH